MVGSSVPERETTLARELEKERSETTRLRATLNARDDEIRVLKHQLKRVEDKSMEEMREKNDRIHGLENELEARAETIAHLTMQLHHVKLRNRQKQVKQTPDPTSTMSTLPSSLARSVSSPTPISLNDMPRPPSTPKNKSQNISRASTPREQSLSPQKRLLPTPPGTDLVVISERLSNVSSPPQTRVPHTKSVYKRGQQTKPQMPPDAEDFLHTTRIQPIHFSTKELPAVLPPIGEGKSRRKVHIKHLNSDREDGGSDVSQIIKNPAVGSGASWQKLTPKHPGSTD